LNDIIVISEDKCACGSSFKIIDQIMGRADDLLWAPRKDTNELQFIFPDYIHRAIINSSELIDEYQVIQRSFSKIEVKILTKTNDIKKEQLKSIVDLNIKNVFRSYNCDIPSIEVRFEPPIKNPYSNKLIRIFRDFKVES
jgi:phenylacetate-coenzyme A ligase PaaK-like adenylate-forming protein